MSALTIFAVIALTRRRMTDRLMLCLLIVASIHDVASCLRWGSNAYYFLPTLAALTIIASARNRSGARTDARDATHPTAGGRSGAGARCCRWVSSSRRAPSNESARGRVTVDSLRRRESEPWDRRALDLLHSIDGPILTDTAELKLVDAQANLQWIDLMVLTSMQAARDFR